MPNPKKRKPKPSAAGPLHPASTLYRLVELVATEVALGLVSDDADGAACSIPDKTNAHVAQPPRTRKKPRGGTRP